MLYIRLWLLALSCLIVFPVSAKEELEEEAVRHELGMHGVWISADDITTLMTAKKLSVVQNMVVGFIPPTTEEIRVDIVYTGTAVAVRKTTIGPGSPERITIALLGFLATTGIIGALLGHARIAIKGIGALLGAGMGALSFILFHNFVTQELMILALQWCIVVVLGAFLILFSYNFTRWFGKKKVQAQKR